MFSDKSHTVLKSSTLPFYPQHVTILNFTEDGKRRYVVDQSTVNDYLPIIFDASPKQSSTAFVIEISDTILSSG